MAPILSKRESSGGGEVGALDRGRGYGSALRLKEV